MGIRKRLASFTLGLAIAMSSFSSFAYADSASVVTLGADLTDAQKQTVLEYFGVKETEVVILDVNNLDERKYLQGVASEAQLGTKTFSCAYVQPTKKGNGINVKTANLTYVTSSMIASTLATCGVEDANVIAMTPLSGGVSGTGALTGVMLAFEDATGEKLDEEKKEIASEELITTGDLGDKIGQDKATGIMNDIKSEVIKNGTQDTTQIANTINNITNNYNVNLTPEQEKQIQDLMSKIAAQNYDYKKLKHTFKNVSSIVDDNLKQLGEKVKHSQGFFEGIADWFRNLFSSKDLGILEKTNDHILGDSAQIDATDNNAIKEEIKNKNNANDSIFTKISNWFSELFGSKTNDKSDNNNENTTNSNSNDASDKTNNSEVNTININDNQEVNSTEKEHSNNLNDSTNVNSSDKENTETSTEISNEKSAENNNK